MNVLGNTYIIRVLFLFIIFCWLKCFTHFTQFVYIFMWLPFAIKSAPNSLMQKSNFFGIFWGKPSLQSCKTKNKSLFDSQIYSLFISFSNINFKAIFSAFSVKNVSFLKREEKGVYVCVVSLEMSFRLSAVFVPKTTRVSVTV